MGTESAKVLRPGGSERNRQGSGKDCGSVQALGSPFCTGGTQPAGVLGGAGGWRPPWDPGRKSGAAHTCTPRPCSWSTRARRAPIPLRRSSRCSADEMPRLTRSLGRRLVRSGNLLPTCYMTWAKALCFPKPGRKTGMFPSSFHAGRLDSLNLVYLDAQSRPLICVVLLLCE